MGESVEIVCDKSALFQSIHLSWVDVVDDDFELKLQMMERNSQSTMSLHLTEMYFLR